MLFGGRRSRPPSSGGRTPATTCRRFLIALGVHARIRGVASASVEWDGIQAIAEIPRPAASCVSTETTVPCIPGNPRPSSSCSQG